MNFNDAFVSFAAGMTSGMVCKCLTAPLSRLTILMQVEGAKELAGEATVRLHQPLHTRVSELIKKEGLTSFWKVYQICEPTLRLCCIIT